MTTDTLAMAKNAKKASKKLIGLTKNDRDRALLSLANSLDEKRDIIIEANRKDLMLARDNDLNAALIDRLELNNDRITSMIEGVKVIASQDNIVGEYFGEFQDKAGLTIKKQRFPLGVILMIFESRPNVVIDCAALAIKSGNSIILKGGKEAKYSNECLGQIVSESIEEFMPKESVQTLASDQRELVDELLSLSDYIDVVIPRGGERLIHHVYDKAKMPVIAHFKGLCHMYIDKDADMNKAVDLVLNAKTQRVGVCNAIETLLVHKDVAKELAEPLAKALSERGTELRVDSSFKSLIPESFSVKEASEKDWDTEYLDNILSIKTVDSLEDAVEHIGEHGSNHSEAIVTQDDSRAQKFISQVDASCVMVNASTRFNDGSQLGLGAELGISTSKLHAYGPMGVEQMTTTRYVIVGDGHIRQ